DQACQRMIEALNDYVILGVKTSIDFLKEVIAHPAFHSGQTTTNFITEHFPNWKGKDKPEDLEKIALIAAAFNSLTGSYKGGGPSAELKSEFSPWLSLGKWRICGSR
ncbi:MAG: acetyl-CoA carboxylase biotin carboxylase subunit, partial [Candidatus Aminicenantes bacterium]|nr:acetyl-CoA carboxylase biotin carboxylase subunit [Candidatus Aminicenantes bacterium]